MKVTRIETRPAPPPPPPPIHEPYEARIVLETNEEARLFWALMCHNLTVPSALIKAGCLDEDKRGAMEELMQDICRGVRSR